MIYLDIHTKIDLGPVTFPVIVVSKLSLKTKIVRKVTGPLQLEFQCSKSRIYNR